MGNGQQMTLSDRVVIEIGLIKGKSISKIAKEPCRNAGPFIFLYICYNRFIKQDAEIPMKDKNNNIYYSTKEIADFMDMTATGIIYLEKHGAVSPQKESNGYRAFSLQDLSGLGEIRNYERMGFSLRESLEMTKYSDPLAKEKLIEKREELKRQIESIDFLISQMDVIEPHVIEEKFLWFPIWEEEETNYSKEKIKELKAIDISWLKNMPYMQYGQLIHKDGTIQKGNIIPLSKAIENNVLITDSVTEFKCKRWLKFTLDNYNFSNLLDRVSEKMQSTPYLYDDYFLAALPRYMNASYNTALIYLPII